MTKKSELHYVYVHFDPETDDILYVGMGKGQRAYAYGSSSSDIRYGHRDQEHSQHLKDLYDKGYLPHEWIDFRYRSLAREDARRLEKELIEELSPKYNRKAGIKSLMFDENQIQQIVECRSSGMSYLNIGKEMGCSTMVAYRILNNKSPRYKEMLVGK